MRFSIVLFLLLACIATHAQQLLSPNGNFRMDFSLDGGAPTYHLSYKGKEIIRPSRLGLELKSDSFSLTTGFVLHDSARKSVNDSWNPVWGEVHTIDNRYNELAVTLD